jgi:hypothetical protein
VEFSFATRALPHLQVWRDLRPHAGIVAVEPCTSERTPDARSGPERPIAPGETRRYSVQVALSGTLSAAQEPGEDQT